MKLSLRNKSSQNSRSNNLTAENLEEFFKGIFKLYPLFILVGVVGGALGFLYFKNQKSAFKSELIFALSDLKPKKASLNWLNLDSDLNIDFDTKSRAFNGDNIFQIMTSRRVVENVLLSIDTFQNKPYRLIEFYLENSNFRTSKIKDIHFPADVSPNQYTYRQDSVLQVVYSKFTKEFLKTRRIDKKLNIYEVSFTARDEQFAKSFTQRIVDSTAGYYSSLRTRKALETVNALASRVASMKNIVASEIIKTASVQDVNMNPAFNRALAAAQFYIMDVQLHEKAYSETLKNLEFAQFKYQNQIPLLQIIDNTDYPLENLNWKQWESIFYFSIGALIFVLWILWMRRILVLSKNDSQKKYKEEIENLISHFSQT